MRTSTLTIITITVVLLAMSCSPPQGHGSAFDRVVDTYKRSGDTLKLRAAEYLQASAKYHYGIKRSIPLGWMGVFNWRGMLYPILKQYRFLYHIPLTNALIIMKRLILILLLMPIVLWAGKTDRTAFPCIYSFQGQYEIESVRPVDAFTAIRMSFTANPRSKFKISNSTYLSDEPRHI